MNTHATTEELLEIAFSVWPMTCPDARVHLKGLVGELLFKSPQAEVE
jgi:hypothetical protein